MSHPIYHTDYSIPGYPVRTLIGETYDDWETPDQKTERLRKAQEVLSNPDGEVKKSKA